MYFFAPTLSACNRPSNSRLVTWISSFARHRCDLRDTADPRLVEEAAISTQQCRSLCSIINKLGFCTHISKVGESFPNSFGVLQCIGVSVLRSLCRNVLSFHLLVDVIPSFQSTSQQTTCISSQIICTQTKALCEYTDARGCWMG